MIYVLTFFVVLSFLFNIACIVLLIAIGRKQVRLEEKSIKMDAMLTEFFGAATEMIESVQEPEKNPTWEQNLLEEEANKNRQMARNLIDPEPRKDNWGAPPAPVEIPNFKIIDLTDKK